MRPDGSDRRDLIFSETLNYVPPRWSPDGRYLAFGFANSYLLVLDADTDEMRRITPENTFDYDPAWSPDGRWLAVVETTLQRTATRIVMVDTQTLARHILPNPSPFSADRMPAWRP
jgi:Tol biopolymer transport system component